MKSDKMERCSTIWWVKSSWIKATWSHCFNLRHSNSWHPSWDSQWSRNYGDVVRLRLESVEINHICSHSWKIRMWDLPVSTKHIWERPLKSKGRNPEWTLPLGAKYQQLCPDKSFICPAQSFLSLIYSPLIKMFTCLTVTAGFRPHQSNLCAKTFQQMTPHKCLKRRTIDLCSHPNRFKSLISSVAGVHI